MKCSTREWFVLLFFKLTSDDDFCGDDVHDDDNDGGGSGLPLHIPPRRMRQHTVSVRHIARPAAHTACPSTANNKQLQ